MASSRVLKLSLIIFLWISSPSYASAQGKGPEESGSGDREECAGYSWKKIALGSAVGATIGVGAVLAAPVVLTAVGFSAGGVVGGSLAAAAQASIGNVAAGSIFATLQSVGAVGGLSATAAGATTVTTAAAGAAASTVV